MGNCAASHGSGKLSADFIGGEEIIMVMRTDGMIMEYMPPLVVRDVMAAFPQHSVAHSEDAHCRSLSPDQKLVPGQLYRLLILPDSPSLSKDAVLPEGKSIDNGRMEGRISSERHASTRTPPSVECVENGSGIIRVKMVMSKRELEALLSHRSIKEKSFLRHLQCKGLYIKEDYVARRRCGKDGWRPSLESIVEVN